MNTTNISWRWPSSMVLANGVLGLLAVGLCPTTASAQPAEHTVARLLWQNQEDQNIHWGDLKKGGVWSLEINELAGFPKLDPDRQKLVQMATSGEFLIVGVRDDQDGEFESGWIAIDSGLERESHGDHDHWHLRSEPTIVRSVLDNQQGNPAHVYSYDGSVFLANDKLDGVTIVKPQAFEPASKQAGVQFIDCGGGHITIAAMPGSVCYGTWIDREGENRGRVDVVGLDDQQGKRYAFHLPTGGIHGATTLAGKVFFAPSDGICWVHADREFNGDAGQPQVHHLSMGEDAEGDPRRTGAFTAHRNWVLCKTGRGATQPELCILDASQATPSVVRFALPTTEGTSVTSPTCIRTRTGEDYALIVEESEEGEETELLHVIELDPNRDGDCEDAKVTKSIPVGPSLIEGHSGHHDITPIGNRLIALTNPGDASVWIISIGNWEVEAKLQVGGVPTRIVGFHEH